MPSDSPTPLTGAEKLKSPKLSVPSRSSSGREAPESDNEPPRQPSKFQQTARYVVSVDHQIKSSFEDRGAAEKEAARILALFPKLAVSVQDSAANSVNTLGATHSKADEED